MIVPRPVSPGHALWPACFLLLAACATRAVPDHFPQRSALSPAASVPKPAAVTRTLSDDPGAAAGPGDADSAPHAHHGGHHHAH
jgi:hypothetical protein